MSYANVSTEQEVRDYLNARLDIPDDAFEVLVSWGKYYATITGQLLVNRNTARLYATASNSVSIYHTVKQTNFQCSCCAKWFPKYTVGSSMVTMYAQHVDYFKDFDVCSECTRKSDVSVIISDHLEAFEAGFITWAEWFPENFYQ